MTAPRRLAAIAAGLALAALLSAALAVPARASVIGSVCKILKPFPVGAGCAEARSGLTAGRQLLQGNVGGAVGGLASGVAGDAATVGLGAIATLAAGSAQFALRETATLIDSVTRPRLEAPWFQRVYWRLAAISVLLTLPCLFAAAVQALIRSDLALLVRAAFGYLPLAMLAVGVCAQVTSLLLTAVDELCSLVSGVGDQAASSFLVRAGAAIVALSARSGSPFLALMIAGFTVAGAIVLWLELMMRAAAVYVVVAMLPLAFAAFVWPARRVWALRALEVLSALILAKLAMVTVLTLAGAALSSVPNVAGFLSGLVLLVLGVLSPWAMLRLVPLAELASGAAGRLRADAGLSGPPSLLETTLKGATAVDKAAGFVARGAGGARAAAESVAEHLADNRSESQGQQSPAAARDAQPEPVAAAQPDLVSQSAEATPPEPSPPEPSPPSELPTPLTAPDQSVELDLSAGASLATAPVWSAIKPAPDKEVGDSRGETPREEPDGFELDRQIAREWPRRHADGVEPDRDEGLHEWLGHEWDAGP